MARTAHRWVVMITLLLLCSPLPGVADATGFEEAFARHPSIMLLIDPQDGQIIAANDAATRFYGYTHPPLFQMQIQQINALPDDAIREEMALARREHRNHFIFQHRLASGQVRTVEVSSNTIDYHGRPLLYSIVRDISQQRSDSDALWHYQNRLETMVDQKTHLLQQQKEQQFWLMAPVIGVLCLLALTLIYMLYQRKQANHLLAQQKERLDDVIWGTHVGTWEWDIPSGQTVFNERWAEIVGYTLEELEPISINTWLSLCHDEDTPHSEALLQKNFSRELDSYECEVRMKHKDGHWVWILDRGKVVEWSADGRPIRMCGTHQDISAQKQLQLELEKLAHYDTLTGLPNRSLFYERAQQVLQYAKRHRRPFALLFVDLDGFKQVNDQLSHEAGDLVLTEAATRMKVALRRSDTVARLGGDEFAILLQDFSNSAAIETVCDYLLTALSQPYTLAGGVSAQLSASIGIACYPEQGSTISDLLKRADAAMYQAKHAGKNRFAFAASHAPTDLNRTVLIDKP